MGAVAAFIIFGGPAILPGPARGAPLGGGTHIALQDGHDWGADVRAGEIVASNGGAAGIMGFRIPHYPGGARDVGASSHEVGAS